MIPNLNFKAPQETIVSIQILRAIAMILVVYHHYNQIFFNWDMSYSFWGSHVGHFLQYDALFGLDLFFLVSGFVIYFILEKNQNAWSFLKSRLIRLIPTYWFYTFVMLIMIELIPHLITSEWNTKSLLSSLFFINHENPSPKLGELPLLPVGWTLNLDLPFYLLCALCVWLCKKNWYVPVVIIMLLSQQIWPSEFMSYFFHSPFLVEFGIGIIFGMIYTRGKIPDSNSLALFLLSIAVVIIAYDVGKYQRLIVAVCVFTSLLVTREAIFNNRFCQFMKQVGDWSFSTYLVHAAFVIPVATIIFGRQAPYNNELLLFSFYTLLTYSLSYLSFKYIERNRLSAWLLKKV